MDRHKIGAWFVDICLGWIMVVVLVLVSKLAYDVLTAPNIFKKETPLTQKQADEMCAAWWFDTDIEAAKKRICKK